jgi:hypothetical protein
MLVFSCNTLLVDLWLKERKFLSLCVTNSKICGLLAPFVVGLRYSSSAIKN